MARLTFAFALLASSVALADPPGRVGRINYVSGEVSYRPATVDDWVPATLNRPLTLGDELWVGQNSRAEVHLGSVAVRLGPNSNVSVLNLDDRIAQLRLAQGEVEVRVRRIEPNEVVEIDLPNAAIQLTHPGSYSMRYDGDQQQSFVVSRAGDLSVTVAGQEIGLEDGQAMQLSGNDQPQYDIVDAPTADDFETWALGRDRREERPRALSYVSRDMVGYEDLDANGRWESDPDNGNVWYPTTVDEGWAPYQYGHWGYVGPWGWTWIDDAPWGFAPFHYGRWVNNGSRWGWLPGAVVARPIYSPALVGWIGGPGAGVSVGWFPLGPREAWVPTYAVNDYYFRAVNAPYARVTTVAAYNYGGVTYANRGYVTVVPHEAFVGARPVREVMVAHPTAGGVVVAHPSAVPTPASIVTHPAGGSVAHPPPAVMTRPVVAVHPAPAARPGAEAHPLVRSATAPNENQTLRPARPGLPEPREARPPAPARSPNAAPRENQNSYREAPRENPREAPRENPPMRYQREPAPRQEPERGPTVNPPARTQPEPRQFERQPQRMSPREEQPVEREPMREPEREAPAEHTAPHPSPAPAPHPAPSPAPHPAPEKHH